ncbi:MAG: hypothetical protein PHY43_05140 [Verrucomicrobiales bacterium]|nr:hypothetical protein [Verrucomicrobiales bacterium]
MTLKEAEDITSHVINLIAAKPRSAYCRVSQLRGHPLPVIYNAFCLVIAKQRQIGSYDPNLRKVSHAYADKADGLVGSLSIAVLCDADVDRLGQLPKESPEFKRLFLEAIHRRREQSDLEWQKTDREAFVAFDNYCWSLESDDPLYWQKIYTHLAIK